MPTKFRVPPQLKYNFDISLSHYIVRNITPVDTCHTHSPDCVTGRMGAPRCMHALLTPWRTESCYNTSSSFLHSCSCADGGGKRQKRRGRWTGENYRSMVLEVPNFSVILGVYYSTIYVGTIELALKIVKSTIALLKCHDNLIAFSRLSWGKGFGK